jgi:cytochrome c-type biogenesis protein
VKKPKQIFIFLVLCAIFISFSSNTLSNSMENDYTNSNFLNSSSILDENTTLYFLKHEGCGMCEAAWDEISIFLNNHPEVSLITYEMSNETELEMAREFLGDPEKLYWPTVVFERGLCKYLINGQSITDKVLEEVYNQIINNPSSCQEWTYYQEFRYWVAFVTGLLSGLSPCIILITGVFGTSLVANRSRNYFRSSMIGFSLGVLIMYTIIGFSFAFFIDGAMTLFSGLAIKLILGIPLIILGLWQCIDAWNQDSRLFNTPDKIKVFFKNLVEKESGLSSFLLGSSFTILKAPCIAGILLSLVFSINQSGAFSPGRILLALGLFAIGVLIPILAVFGILRLGISNEKINNFRVKARPFLRLISGLVIIVTTIFVFI